MCKRLNWDKTNRERKVKCKSMLPPKKEYTELEKSEIRAWYNSLTKRQRRLIRGRR